MEDLILQIMAVRVYPIIGALREISKQYIDISEQRKIAEEFFEYLENNDILQNSDTQYYRNDMWRLFEIIENTYYIDSYGRTIFTNSFKYWNSESFYRCFIFGGKYIGMIESVHSDEFEEKYKNVNSLNYKKYCSDKSRFIRFKKREYQNHMIAFLTRKKENNMSLERNI